MFVFNFGGLIFFLLSRKYLPRETDFNWSLYETIDPNLIGKRAINPGNFKSSQKRH